MKNTNKINETYLKALEWLDSKKAEEIMQVLLDDIDIKEWFYKEKKEEKFNIEKLDFEESVEELSKHGILVEVDDYYHSIKLYLEWNFIWEIYNDAYIDKNFSSTEHLYKEINEEYRWKGYWKLLFELYIKKSNEDPRFILPVEDYTKKVSVINLYEKFWYEIIWKINSLWEYTKITKEDIKEIKEIKNNLKKWFMEYQLNYTVVLKRKR